MGGSQDDDAYILKNTSVIDLANGTLLLFVSTTEVSSFPNNGSCSNDDDYCNPLYAVPTGLIVLLSFLYGSISVLAVVGNFLVMWIVATSRRMQNVTNCYIANLALADIVIGLFAIPFQFQAALLQRWVFPDFMCAFCPFVQALSVNVSVFTLTAIAVDRHRAILTPLSARPSKRVAKCIIACIWVLALSLAIPMAISWEMIISKVRDPDTMMMDEKPFCAPSDFGTNSLHIYRLALFLLQYLTPLCIITCAYARMAYKLWGSKAPGNAQDSRDANILKNKKKVIKMLVIVVTLFALCWMPLQTYYLMQTYFPDINEYKYINIMFFCFDWLAMSNSCYNPFIYGIYNEKFKREFKQRFPFCRSQKGKSLADSIDIDKNISFQTRLSSFRSTCDSRRQSTRLSIALNTQVNVQPNYRKSVRSGMFCYKNGVDTGPEFREVASKRNTPNAKPPDLKSDEVSLNFNNGNTEDASFRYNNGSRPRCKLLTRDLDAIFDRKSDSVDSASPEDERVTELYIFPNSNIIELKDNVQERKL